jgi:predicted hydrolase (HD superfamily)
LIAVAACYKIYFERIGLRFSGFSSRASGLETQFLSWRSRALILGPQFSTLSSQASSELQHIGATPNPNHSGTLETMTRDEAWKLVCDFTPSESLRRHMRTVEAVMVHFAERSGGHSGQQLSPSDLEKWAVTGLLHDFDYESHPDLGPDGHPFWGVNYLRQNSDLTEDVLEAILGHYTGSGVARVTALAQTLFAVDELSGLITAAALVRPDKSVMNLEVSSIMKKMKDKAFAKGVNREDIRTGAAELGIEVEKLVTDVLSAMQSRAEALGLGLRES